MIRALPLLLLTWRNTLSGYMNCRSGFSPICRTNSLLKNSKSKELMQSREDAKKAKYRVKTKAIRNQSAFKTGYCHTGTLLPDFLFFASLRLRVRSFLSHFGVFQQAAKARPANTIILIIGLIVASPLLAVTSGNFNQQQCIGCHKKTDAQLVSDWQRSAHALQQPQALCTNCHGTDHATVGATSRRNDTCINCHGGSSSPVVHSYASSKHGIIMQLEQKTYDWNQPLRDANYRAPGCAYCHLHKGNHFTGKSGKLKPATGDMDRITSVCMDCHAPRYIAQLNDNALRMIDIASMKMREARTLVEKQGATNTQLDSYLQQTEKHLRNVYLGAFHQSPDYQWWHGQPALDGDLIRIRGIIGDKPQATGDTHE